MINQIPWTSRTFSFDFPIGVFPCIIVRLRGTPVRIEEMVEGMSEEALAVRPAPDTWSTKEQIGHLSDLDPLHEGRIDDFLAGAPILRGADIRNPKTFEANHNAKSIRELLQQFQTGRAKFTGRLEEIDERQAGLVAIHPRLQIPMRMVDMAYFVAEHDDHHLAKIAQILQIFR